MKHSGPDIEAMAAIARAAKVRVMGGPRRLDCPYRPYLTPPWPSPARPRCVFVVWVGCISAATQNKLKHRVDAVVPPHVPPHGVCMCVCVCVCVCVQARSLEQFQGSVATFSAYLKTDDLIAHHLDELYDNMLEANLLKVRHI